MRPYLPPAPDFDNAPRRRPSPRVPAPPARHGLARVLSKLGVCSRAQAAALVRAGRVRVDGVPRRDPDWPVLAGRDRLELDGAPLAAAAPVYVMLHKPRGLVTTAADERGRPTVFACLAGAALPHLAPVGRLDQASEGLLLLTNDTAWAAALTDPTAHVPKTYHVQVNALADAALCRRLEAGVTDAGERLAVRRAAVLRRGQKNAWLELVLDEGRNRHLRRLLAALGLDTLRLVRVAVGRLPLGDLAKGAWRHLTTEEMRILSPGSGVPSPKSQV
jgi:23S rRNA pseudouridine2605 synthase